jgi:hypothetical protein
MPATPARATKTHADRSASQITMQATLEPPADPVYNEQKKTTPKGGFSAL